MRKKLLLSISTLAAVLAIGGGATYALFTSNIATISTNTLTSGSAQIAICDSTVGNTWIGTITPAFVLKGLTPGGDAKELTGGATIYLGNDDGTLNGKIGGGICPSGSAGTSTTALKMVPAISVPSCDTLAPTDLLLDFSIGGNDSGYFDLPTWNANTGTVLPNFNPGDTSQVKIFAKLKSTATAQNKSCIFDVTFTGNQ